MEATIKKAKNITNCVVAAGFIMYLSKFTRSYFRDNESIEFILGFLPNFGMALALPFIYVSNRIRWNKPVKHFIIACAAAVLLLILNEVRDYYDPKRVFDWYDIYATAAGVVCSFLLFHFVLKKELVQLAA